MTDIEQKAQALLREVEDERGTTSSPGINRVSNNHEALCRAIEQREALKARVAELEDVAGYLLTRFDPWSPHDHDAAKRARAALGEEQ